LIIKDNSFGWEFILTHCGRITRILVFSVLGLVTSWDFIPFNNYGEHDKILNILIDNFSNITNESERSEEDDSDSDESSDSGSDN